MESDKSIDNVKSGEVATMAEFRTKSPVSYDYTNDKVFSLSQREKVICDTFIETQSVLACTKALEAKKLSGSMCSVRRWLDRPHVKSYIYDLLKKKAIVAGFQGDDWQVMGIEALLGMRTLTADQIAIWREIGKAKGFYKDTGHGVGNAIQINFLQQDGNR